MNKKINKQQDIINLFPKSPDEINILVDQYMKETDQDVDQIIAIDSDKRTFENTVKAFDKACSLSNLSTLTSSIHALEMLSPDEKIREAAHKAIIKIQEFYVEKISNNIELYKAFKEYTDKYSRNKNLTTEEKYFIDETLKDFKRAGLELSKEKLEEVKKLNKELGTLNLEFESNIASDKSCVKASKDDLKGLDDEFIKNLSKTDDGNYCLYMDYPTYFNIMDNCEIEETRKRMSLAFNNRAYPTNYQILKNIIAKRDTLAKTLGFESYSHLDLDGEMVKTPQQAQEFITDLWQKATIKEQKELDQISCQLPDSVNLTDSGKIKSWDQRYLKNQYKKKNFQIDEQKIAEYFPMENTTEQLLSIYQEFLDLKFEQSTISGLWHDDLKAIKVKTNDNKVLGYLIVDLYPRPNKYSHACQMTIFPAVKSYGPAVAVVVANFPKSTKTKPSLLQRIDVETFFHEFGHALHAILGRTSMASFSGTNVKMDFVEMPSQMLEEWLSNKDILKRISCHYKDNSSLPDELIDKILSLKNFDSGNFIKRQCYLSSLALEYFNPGAEKDPKQISMQLQAKMRKNIAFDPDEHMYASFGHLSGYGARYYSYMWSKVFAIDMFCHIKKHGLLNPEIGSKYSRQVLCKGGSQDPNILIKNFLGREPNQEAMLKELEII